MLLGLVVFGIGQGSACHSVVQCSGHSLAKGTRRRLGSLRRTTNNLAAAVGTATAGALLVGLLSTAVLSRIATNPVLAGIDATHKQVADAVRVNTEARLRGL